MSCQVTTTLKKPYLAEIANTLNYPFITAINRNLGCGGFGKQKTAEPCRRTTGQDVTHPFFWLPSPIRSTSNRLKRTKGWIINEALRQFISQEDRKLKMLEETEEAIADIEANRLISGEEVR